MRLISAIVLLTAFVSGCDPEPPSGQLHNLTQSNRRARAEELVKMRANGAVPILSALTVASGTCNGACGGQAKTGDCWCDDVCSSLGDCCADKVSTCGAAKTDGGPVGSDAGSGEGVASCKSSCGGQAPSGSCWCDDSCESYQDCCADKVDYCGAAPKPDGGPGIGDGGSAPKPDGGAGIFDGGSAPTPDGGPGIGDGGSSGGGEAGVGKDGGTGGSASCKGICGGSAPGGCWCDSVCESLGDCCSDKVSVCGMTAGKPDGGGGDAVSGEDDGGFPGWNDAKTP